jgi:hypothetical protein
MEKGVGSWEEEERKGDGGEGEKGRRGERSREL